MNVYVILEEESTHDKRDVLSGVHSVWFSEEKAQEELCHLENSNRSLSWYRLVEHTLKD